ncbi:hypothetical protein [Rhizobium oryziradicis]|uniref:Uncharacterized protein n=1 Tax=Rhizobium oryziradicis TaxID=1867956 RepID=A0A1Q8ZRP9_9HYPH|nr:hypothetical protein [Rhizobium oryziradicis]OLP44727.1 hypothetical protein BJF95_09605 [Rhizobium oryziradicis]
MSINEKIKNEMQLLKNAYTQLSNIKRLDAYSVDTLFVLECVEREIREREYAIAHMKAYQETSNTTENDDNQAIPISIYQKQFRS